MKYQTVDERVHKFRSDASFERVITLYKYDEVLRSLLFSLISKIEIYFRSKIAYTLSVKYNDPFIIYNSNNFKKIKEYTECLKLFSEEITRSKETFIKHYKNKYVEADKNELPIWVLMEVLSFGTLSKLYKSMIDEDKNIISNELNIPSEVLGSWLHSISYIRNVCAHNGRVINRELAIKPKQPRKIKKWQYLDNSRIFNLIVTIEYIIKKAKIDY